MVVAPRHARVVGWLLLGPLLGSGLLPAPPARAEEAPAPAAAPGTYADHDAAWWVGELRGAGTQRVAVEALQVIGAPAIPAIAGVLNHHDPVLREVALKLLTDLPGSLDVARDAVALALEESQDVGRDARLLKLVARMPEQGASLAPLVVRRLVAYGGDLRTPTLATLERTGGDPGVLVPALRPLLLVEDRNTLVTTLRVLAGLGAAAQPVVADLLVLLRAPEVTAAGYRRRGRATDVALQAITVLARVGRVGSEAHALLADLARDEALGLGRAATQALAEIALTEPAAAEPLVALLEASGASTRGEALAALSTLRPLPPDAVARIVRLLESGPPDQAYQAAQLLQQARADPEVYLGALLRTMGKGPSYGNLLEILRGAANASPEAFVRAIPADLDPPSAMLLGVFSQFADRIGASPARDLALDHLARWLARLSGPSDPRFQAGEVLLRVGGEGPGVVERLQPLLEDPDAARRDLAVNLLARLPAARTFVSGLLGAAEARRRLLGLRILEALRQGISSEEDATLLSLLGDPDAEVRATTALLLVSHPSGRGSFAPTRPVEERAAIAAALVEVLGSADPAQRTRALAGLSTLGCPCPAAADPLLALLSDDELTAGPDFVASVLARTVAADPASVRPRLRAQLAAPEAPVARAGAALALATMGEERDAVLAALPSLLSSGPWSGRWRALLALARLGENARDFEAEVRALAAYPHHVVSGEACRLLATASTSRSPENRAALAALARDRTKAWRAVAVEPLASFGGAATEDLLALLGDSDLRGHALAALQRLGPLAHDALPALEEELRRTPRDDLLRRTIDAIRPP